MKPKLPEYIREAYFDSVKIKRYRFKDGKWFVTVTNELGLQEIHEWEPNSWSVTHEWKPKYPDRLIERLRDKKLHLVSIRYNEKYNVYILRYRMCDNVQIWTDWYVNVNGNWCAFPFLPYSHLKRNGFKLVDGVWTK